jgi:hypothetical protein
VPKTSLFIDNLYSICLISTPNFPRRQTSSTTIFHLSLSPSPGRFSTTPTANKIPPALINLDWPYVITFRALCNAIKVLKGLQTLEIRPVCPTPPFPVNLANLD